MLRLVILCVVMLSAANAPAVTLMGAGAGGDGWLLTYDDELKSGWIVHLPSNAPPGVFMPALDISIRTEGVDDAPEAIAAWGQTLYLVFPPDETTATDEEPVVRRVRQLRVGSNPAAGYYTYDPPNRLAALPGLVGEIEIAAFGAGPSGPVAVITDRSENADGPARFLWLRQTTWHEVTAPDDLVSIEGLVPLDRMLIGVIGIGRDGERRLWSAVEPPVPTREDATDEPQDAAEESAVEELADSVPLSPEWASRRTLLDPASSFVTSIDGFLYGVTPLEEARVELSLESGGQQHVAGVFDLSAVDYTVLTVGSDVVLVYPPSKVAAHPPLTVISPSTSGVIYEGVARRISPVTENDLRFLGVLFGAVLLTVALFILKPRVAMRESVDFPPHTALAEPSRRVAAVLVDFIPCAVVAGLVFEVSVIDVIVKPFQDAGPEGVWPAIVALGVLFIHSSISEWLWGRSVGKLLLSCRTISVTGVKPTLRQAVWRNAIKALCPPLIIVLYLDPRGRHPGDLVSGTLVIVDLPIPAEPESVDEGLDRLGLEGDGPET